MFLEFLLISADMFICSSVRRISLGLLILKLFVDVYLPDIIDDPCQLIISLVLFHWTFADVVDDVYTRCRTCHLKIQYNFDVFRVSRCCVIHFLRVRDYFDS